jgi:hypothetical protein
MGKSRQVAGGAVLGLSHPGKIISGHFGHFADLT